MNTTIALINNQWHVVQSKAINGIMVWYPISQGYTTSLEARTAQANIIFGRVS